MKPLSPYGRFDRVLDSQNGKERARAAGEGLFALGAIASLTGEPRPILIGDMQWLGDTELVMFTAYGEGADDAHLVCFDEVMVNEEGSLTFLAGGNVVGAIHRIEDADVDDPDDYRIAWQLWQDVAPLHQPMIQRCYQRVQNYRRIDAAEMVVAAEVTRPSSR